MKAFLLLALCSLGLSAADLSFTISPAYVFADTPQGQASTVVVSVRNTSGHRVSIIDLYVGSSDGSAAHTPDYRVTGFDQGGHVLGPGASTPFTVNFTPTATGILSGFLQVDYGVEENGCVIADNGTVPLECAIIAPVSTLQGTGTAPSWLLSYVQGGVTIIPTPNSSSRLDFGPVTPPNKSSLTFTVANQTSAPISTPSVSLVFPSGTAFSLNTSNLSSTIPADGSVSFTVTFAPASGNALTTNTLSVGINSYGIEGTSQNALDIEYTDSTGVRSIAQSTINFPNAAPGSAATLNFTVQNPAIALDPVIIPSVSVSGSGFQLTGAPATPVTLQPGGAPLSFSVTFSAPVAGSFSGILRIGNLTFSLTGLGVVSPVPPMSFQLSQSPLASSQQVDLTILAATPATQTHLGTLTMQFTPAVNGVADDPAIFFVDTQGRELQVTSAAGSQSVTYNNQSLLTFQTGTTAGTITFTLTFTDTPPLTGSYTIGSTAIHISSAQATRSTPNLKINVTGFDNTYTAGQLSFVFLDAKGNKMNAQPISVDAAASFHQLFFTDNPAGGAFALQVTFPVTTGDISKIASVKVTLANSAGEASSNLTFQ